MASPPTADSMFQRFSALRQETNDFATLVYGHAGKAKILKYDLQELVQRGAIRTALSAQGTMFSEGALGKTLGGYFACGIFSALVMTCLIAGTNPDLQGLGVEDLEKLAFYLNGFIPFILGFYLLVNLTRWWALRETGIGRMLDAGQNVILILASCFPAEEFHEFHDQVLKYAIVSISMMINACRGNDSIDNFGPKRDCLLTQEELEILKNVSCKARPLMMWAWIFAMATKFGDERDMPAARQRDVSLQCCRARDAVSVIWTYLNTQLPFAYVHLVTLLVNVNNLVMACKCGIVFSVTCFTGDGQKAINQLAYITVVPLLYHGLLSISYIIHDPFGEDMLDFPIMAYQEYMNEAGVSMILNAGKCPALSQQWAWCRHTDTVKPENLPTASSAANLPVAGPPKELTSAEPPPQVSSKPEVSLDDSKQLLMLAQMQAKDDLIKVLTEQNHSLKDRHQSLDSEIVMLRQRMSDLESQLASRVRKDRVPVVESPSRSSCR